jgi:hypothetical protein
MDNLVMRVQKTLFDFIEEDEEINGRKKLTID